MKERRSGCHRRSRYRNPSPEVQMMGTETLVGVVKEIVIALVVCELDADIGVKIVQVQRSAKNAKVFINLVVDIYRFPMICAV